MKFGENLKKLRKSKNISQEELADKVGVSRQSVSKWETGDAYPEMNNILQLCKIFHCEINSLVNDNMVDMDSLDEEIKMNVVKFKEDKQKKMKGLSKAIYVIARIGKVVVSIGIVALAIAMLVIPFVGFNVKSTNNNAIEIFNKTISYERSNTEIKLTVEDESHTVTDLDDVKALNIVIDYVEEHNIGMVSVILEFVLVCLEVTLFLSYFTFKYLDKLFVNINRGDTPFTMDNVNYIKKIAYLMIGLIVFPSISGLIASIFISSDIDFSIDGISLLYVLIIFSLSYIFEYGYQIQLDSNGKMYGDNNE